MASWVLALAKSTDCVAIANLSKKEVENGLRWRWRPSRVLEMIRNPVVSVLIAKNEETLCGFGMMEYAETSAHLNLLAVSPPYRRQQVGSALLLWLEKTALYAGVQLINLEVRAHNRAAIAFYKRAGYVVTGKRAGYYDGVEDAVSMQHRIIPEDLAAGWTAP